MIDEKMFDCDDFDPWKIYSEFERSEELCIEKCRRQECTCTKLVDVWRKRVDAEEKAAIGSLASSRRKALNSERETEKMASEVEDLKTAVKAITAEKSKGAKYIKQLDTYSNEHHRRLELINRRIQEIKRQIDSTRDHSSRFTEQANTVLDMYRDVLGLDFAVQGDNIVVRFKHVADTESASGHEITLKVDASSFRVVSTSPPIKIPKVHKYSTADSSLECWRRFLLISREQFASLYRR